MATASVEHTFGDLNKDSLIALLGKLIGESKYVQNNPTDLIPEDGLVIHVLDVIRPFSTGGGGGPLVLNHVTYKPNIGNLTVEYAGTQPGKRSCPLLACTWTSSATPSDWDFDPFSLSIEEDKLRGRRTTDCLGHVALVTELMRKLGESKPTLKSTVVAVYC